MSKNHCSCGLKLFAGVCEMHGFNRPKWKDEFI